MPGASFFLCLVMPLCSYLYGGLYGGWYERAHIIRYFPQLYRVLAGRIVVRAGPQMTATRLGVRAATGGSVKKTPPQYILYGSIHIRNISRLYTSLEILMYVIDIFNL